MPGYYGSQPAGLPGPGYYGSQPAGLPGPGYYGSQPAGLPGPKKKAAPPPGKTKSAQKAAAPVPKVRVWTDPSGKNPPIIEPLPSYTTSPLDPTVGARMQASAGLGNPMMAAAAGNPVTTVQGGGIDPMEQARLNALNAVLAKLAANPQRTYIPGTADDPYRGQPGYSGQPYAWTQTVGSNVEPGMDPGDVRPGAAATPQMRPYEQQTAPAIAAYILRQWGTPDGRQDPNVGNMSAANIDFLRNLT